MFVVLATVVAAWLIRLVWPLLSLDFREAYAAWDTGTLVIEYLETHDGRWPQSWDDLLTVLEGERGRQVMLYGASAGDVEYARSLRRRVAIDWTADPADLSRARLREGAPPFRAVTRPDGSDFETVWEGAEPNELIWRYLRGEHEE